MTIIDKAVAWAVAIAADDSHGYDQGNRWGPDYDCSSLVISAYEQAGVPLKTVYGATRTRNMVPQMLEAGFADVTKQVDLNTGAGMRKGDVVWRAGHVEMIVKPGQLVGAHYSETNGKYGVDGDQTGFEISLTDYKNKSWTKCFRYPGGSDEGIPAVTIDQTINSNEFLSLDEMYNNALYIASFFLRNGWTLEAIAGLLGNLQTESNMNPGIWENLDEGNTSGGFGLVQWTPATKLIEWASSQGLNYKSMDTQLQRILYEMENGVQYYPTANYPETFKEFSQSTKTPEYLAGAFLYNYERPAEPNPTLRGQQARYWYNILSSIDPNWLMGLTSKEKGMSLLLMWAACRGRYYVV